MRGNHFASLVGKNYFLLSHLSFWRLRKAALQAEINIGGLNFDKIPPGDS